MDKTIINHKIVFNILQFAFLIFTSAAYGQDQNKSEIPVNLTELQNAIEIILSETETPAIGIGMVNGDSLTWVTGLGKGNIEYNVKADANTMFRIGSVSKMFVSLAILKLQEEGLVDLKNKVRDLVPEVEFTNLWKATNPILVEQLLEHTTGWDDWHLTEFALNDSKPLTLKEGLDFHPHSRISRWVPGTRYAYSNSGPAVAAYIVEKITGEKFEDYIQKEFFQPMGMETATYFNSEKYKRSGATLYINGKPVDYWNIIMRPSGAINASANDMAKLVRFFTNRGKIDGVQLISEKSIERLESPESTPTVQLGLQEGYGLSNYSSIHNNFVYRCHDGSVDGAITNLSYLPEYGMGYIIMINAENYSAVNQISNLIRDFQTRELTVPLSKANAMVNNSETNISTGFYIGINPRFETMAFVERVFNFVHLSKDKDTLYTSGIMGSFKHLPMTKNSYTSAATGQINLVQIEDPLVGNVIHIGSMVYKKESAVIVIGKLAVFGLWILFMIVAIISGCIWAIRYWLNKVSKETNKWIRMWPLVTSMVLISIVVILITLSSSVNIANKLGTINGLSVFVMLLIICFALGSFYSLIYIICKRNDEVNKATYWMSAILSGLHALVTCYLLLNGVIGMKFWG
jgi:CubicO group peptidase (beta-lactamase class C family)